MAEQTQFYIKYENIKHIIVRNREIIYVFLDGMEHRREFKYFSGVKKRIFELMSHYKKRTGKDLLLIEEQDKEFVI